MKGVEGSVECVELQVRTKEKGEMKRRENMAESLTSPR